MFACVCVFVSLSLRLLVTNDVMWCDIMDPIGLVKQQDLQLQLLLLLLMGMALIHIMETNPLKVS